MATPAIVGDLDNAVPPPAGRTTSASIDFVYTTREPSDNHVTIEDTIPPILDSALDSVELNAARLFGDMAPCSSASAASW